MRASEALNVGEGTSLPRETNNSGSSEPLIRLMAKWREAHAKTAAADPETESDEEALSRLLDEQEELARRLMHAPVSSFLQLSGKVEVLEHTLRWQHECGQFNDCRDVMMIEAIKADVLRLARASTLRELEPSAV